MRFKIMRLEMMERIMVEMHEGKNREESRWMTGKIEVQIVCESSVWVFTA